MKKEPRMEILKRRTAYKFWIKDIINAIPISQEGLNLFEVRGREASRVNIIATIVDKQINEEKTYATITLDDGTETIRVKTWREDIAKLENVNIGDPVIIIGKIRYSNEIFITPEVVKKQEPEWLLVRKKELERLYGKPEEKQEKSKEETKQEVIEEIVEELTETARQKILGLVEKADGIQISQLMQESGLKEEEAEKIIDELLKEGELFQPRTGFLKVI